MTVRPQPRPPGRLRRWLLESQASAPREGFYENEDEVESQDHKQPWWRVMCLTGVDYFSTLGYQPGIAALAAGALSPFATLVLVIVTLLGALPMYRRVAKESPHGDGSISMLADLLPYWQGKLLVLALIGFVATGFVITITLSAADATAHIVENPLVNNHLDGLEVPITLLLIALLGAVFLKGFGEAIGIAVVLVVTYIGLSLVVVLDGLYFVAREPAVISNWMSAISASYASPLAVIGAALLVFPRLALGLSGFETGVVVMPLIQGDPTDKRYRPRGRIRNGKKLLTAAALVMSVMLISSSLVTTLLIPAAEFKEGGAAYGRALAYLAHKNLGEGFGTAYDVATVLILWFAGASAMAGLLNIVPRYLPRYGMAPDWARTIRPLVLIFTAICFLVTLAFRANVEAQAGAYATGVLAVMTSAAIAVTLSARRLGENVIAGYFAVVTLVFVYTSVVTIAERPEGLQIASLFIAAIVVVSVWSRAARATELRTERVELDHTATRFVVEAGRTPIRVVYNPVRRTAGDDDEAFAGDGLDEIDEIDEYRAIMGQMRFANHLPEGSPVMFLEVRVTDASDFSGAVDVRGEEIGGFRVLRAESPALPNAIAAIALHLRDVTGTPPHVYFGWTEQGVFRNALGFLLGGEGDAPPLTHEILRLAEPDRAKRPRVHVGG